MKGLEMNQDVTVQVFVAPGPGGWMRLADHFPGALTPEYQRLYTETCPPGMAAYMTRYGVVAKSLDVAFVNGHLYITPVPIFGPREMRRTPPVALVWLMARLHPEFRRRTRAAHRALIERPWRAATDHWFNVERFVWQERNAAIELVDASTLTTESLIDHLGTCRALVRDGYRRHFELHGDDLLPIGLLIARCAEWGIAPSIATRALNGASPLSAGTTVPPQWQMVTGYDLDGLAWCELSSKPEPQSEPKTTALDLASIVPSEYHDELVHLVNDARRAVPLRDDNGALTGAWPMGLLRRAMLEAGQRIAPADPSLAIEATVDELISTLAERTAALGRTTTEELRHRRLERRRQSGLDAPTRLGPEFAIPPLAALPRSLALIAAAQIATADHMMSGTKPIGIGIAPYRGRAIVVENPNDALDLIEPGDVVVTRFTSPTWNMVLVHAGAIVTTTGGLVSHAAVLARELAIPAVLGDPTAMARFTTGMMITVDPLTATVSV